MLLELNIKDKEISFVIGEVKGQGLEDLIKNLSREVSEIVVSGESKSYTSLRQIALAVNILVYTNHAKIDLRSKSFLIKEGLLVPIYD